MKTLAIILALMPPQALAGRFEIDIAIALAKAASQQQDELPHREPEPNVEAALPTLFVFTGVNCLHCRRFENDARGSLSKFLAANYIVVRKQPRPGEGIPLFHVQGSDVSYRGYPGAVKFKRWLENEKRKATRR